MAELRTHGGPGELAGEAGAGCAVRPDVATLRVLMPDLPPELIMRIVDGAGDEETADAEVARVVIPSGRRPWSPRPEDAQPTGDVQPCFEGCD
ncbi:hypothetical protein [Actinokineospora enzanensis]|uniref:hypothetical protein n=1 Tax=Actinokineospora enzanensis TaxID=155975 RepID=UPI00039DC6C1|nr:hypothetical protein [Actinokineospora enzanensis]